MSTIATTQRPTFKGLGLRSKNGQKVVEATNWEVCSGWVRPSADFRCGECLHMHRKFRDLTHLNAKGIIRTADGSLPLLMAAACDHCASINVFPTQKGYVMIG